MRYISLLRGINVSGRKQIRMADLKALYESAGFKNVTTYIQSGNVIFDSCVKDKSELSSIIENSIREHFKFEVPVEIRTHRELANVIKNCPFGPVDPEKDGSRVLVSFLSAIPGKAQLDDVLKYAATSEHLVLKGREVYLHCPNGYGKSKLSNAFLEKKLGVGATTRNWKSVSQLYELSR